MSRWIDADALKIPSEEIIAKMIINSAPSIDIVRCKECVEYDDEWCMYWQNVVDAYDFCSYGEREGE